MMTYFQGSNKRRNIRSRIPTIVVAILIVIIIAIRFLLPSMFMGFFTAIARPFWRMEFSLSSGQLSSAETLLSANQDLLRKLDEANVKSQSITALIAENEQLKALMGRASTTDLILAAVIQKPPMAPYDELILDAGTNLGFEVGDMVYAADRVPVGKISSVMSNSSRVLLFSSSGQSFNVFIGKSNNPAMAIGKGGGHYSAELPRSVNISEGDIVGVPSLKSNLFGIVDATVADPSQPFQTILFSAPINIYELRWVLVEGK